MLISFFAKNWLLLFSFCREDRVYRHLEPALAFQLELNRLKNYDLAPVQVSNHKMHLYFATAKKLSPTVSKNLLIFTHNLLKFTQIYSNLLKFTQIYSIILNFTHYRKRWWCCMCFLQKWPQRIWSWWWSMDWTCNLESSMRLLDSQKGHSFCKSSQT